MNKTKALRVALLLIPLMVVVIAVTPGSVTVIDTETVYTATFMEPIEESIVGWCAPVAALLNYVVFAAVVIYCLTKKEFWLKGVFGISFAALFLAAIPIVMEGTPKIIPNVLALILFGVQCILARLLMKPEAVQEDKGGMRLTKY